MQNFTEHHAVLFWDHLSLSLHNTSKCFSLRKKCLYSELFWSAFSRIRTEYGETPVSLRIQIKGGKMWTRITPNTGTFYALLKNFPQEFSRVLLSMLSRYIYVFLPKKEKKTFSPFHFNVKYLFKMEFLNFKVGMASNI